MVKRTSFLLVLAAVLTAMLGTVKCQDGDGTEKCGMNMVYAPCDGSCPKTCQDVSNMGLPKSCTMDCNPGCVCVPGYVLQNGKCIPEKDCPCNKHAHYETCGSACPLTCDNYSNPPQLCIMPCVLGCFCDKGYVKSGNACVLPAQCSGATSS